MEAENITVLIHSCYCIICSSVKLLDAFGEGEDRSITVMILVQPSVY